MADTVCEQCNVGIMRSVAKPGRTMRGGRGRFVIPANIAIPTCDQCGARHLDADLLEVLAVAEEKYLTK